MKISSGILPGQVLQRDKNDFGAAAIAGTCQAKGVVEFSLSGSGWREAGRADGSVFRAAVKAVPAGGPYVLQLRVRDGRKILDSATVKDIFCGDVWLMGGQSNMQGCGNMIDAPKPHPLVRAFFMRDEWEIASEPMHFLPEAVDSFHNGYGDGPGRPSCGQLEKMRGEALKGVSPGLFFGIEMHRRTGVPQGLVACAHGGTSMEQWSPALRDQGGASLYGAMMRRFEKLGQPVRGMIWYQGESDSWGDAIKLYTERMVELVACSRRDMKQPGLPWLVVQIGCHIARDSDGGWNSIQEQQRLLPERIRHLDVAPAVDLQLDDGIHIGGKGQAILGRRLVRLAERLALRTPGAKGGIRFKRAKRSFQPPLPGEPAVSLLTLEYDGVVGGLQSAGLPGGFAILDACGNVQDAIYKTRLAGGRVLIETQYVMDAMRAMFVSYAHGRYSYCNITDADGMCLPAMCRVPLSGDSLPFALDWQAARLRENGSIGGLSCKAALAVANFAPAVVEQGYVVLPLPLGENRNGVFTFKTTVKAAAACETKLLFGADSPFILWLNGREVMRDPHAVNPCTPSEYTKRVALKKGENSITVAFDSRNGAGWGICLSFRNVRRKDKLHEILAY